MKSAESKFGVVIIIFALTFFALMPLKIHFSNTALHDGICFSVAAVIITGIYLIIKDYKLQEGLLTLICLMTFPLFLFTQAYILSGVKENLLKKDGVKCTGIIKEQWISDSKGSKGEW